MQACAGEEPEFSRAKVQRSEDLSGRGLVANGEKATRAIPIVAEPRQVQVAPGIVPVEIRHTAAAMDLRDRAQTNDRELALFIGVFLPEDKQMLDIGWFPSRFLHRRNRVLRRGGAVEVEVAAFELDFALPLIGKRLVVMSLFA